MIMDDYIQEFVFDNSDEGEFEGCRFVIRFNPSENTIFIQFINMGASALGNCGLNYLSIDGRKVIEGIIAETYESDYLQTITINNSYFPYYNIISFEAYFNSVNYDSNYPDMSWCTFTKTITLPLPPINLDVQLSTDNSNLDIFWNEPTNINTIDGYFLEILNDDTTIAIGTDSTPSGRKGIFLNKNLKSYSLDLSDFAITTGVLYVHLNSFKNNSISDNPTQKIYSYSPDFDNGYNINSIEIPIMENSYKIFYRNDNNEFVQATKAFTKVGNSFIEIKQFHSI